MSDIGTTQPMSEELKRAVGLLTLKKKMIEDGKGDSIALLALARKISEVPEATLAQAKQQVGHDTVRAGTTRTTAEEVLTARRAVAEAPAEQVAALSSEEISDLAKEFGVEQSQVEQAVARLGL